MKDTITIPSTLQSAFEALRHTLGTKGNNAIDFADGYQRIVDFKAGYEASGESTKPISRAFISILSSLQNALGALQQADQCAAKVREDALTWLDQCRDALARFHFDFVASSSTKVKLDTVPLMSVLKPHAVTETSSLEKTSGVQCVLSDLPVSLEAHPIKSAPTLAVKSEVTSQLDQRSSLAVVLAKLGIHALDLVSLSTLQLDRIHSLVRSEGLFSAGVNAILAELNLRPVSPVSQSEDDTVVYSSADSESELSEEDQQDEFCVMIHDSTGATHAHDDIKRLAEVGGVATFTRINRDELDLFFRDLCYFISSNALKLHSDVKDKLVRYFLSCVSTQSAGGAPLIIDLRCILGAKICQQGVALTLQSFIDSRYVGFESALTSRHPEHKAVYSSILSDIEALAGLINLGSESGERVRAIVSKMTAIENKVTRGNLPESFLSRVAYRYGLLCKGLEAFLKCHQNQACVKSLLMADSYGLRRFCRGVADVSSVKTIRAHVLGKVSSMHDRLARRRQEIAFICRSVARHAGTPRASRSGMFSAKERLVKQRDDRGLSHEAYRYRQHAKLLDVMCS